MDIRYDLLTFFEAALEAVDGSRVVAEALPEILKEQLSSQDIADMQIVSIGKAAESMLQGAHQCLGEITGRSLLISKSGYISSESYNTPLITCIESAHPVPDESSLVAGDALIQFLQQSQAPCLFLISGGTSSLVEVLADNWSLDELQEVTQWMLANAYSISQINAVRSDISKIKRGGLWNYFNNRKVICLLISDVPNDDVAIIGSGLLFPDSHQSKNIPDSHTLPRQWKQKLKSFSKPQPPSSFYWQIIASNQHAKQAAEKKAIAASYRTKVIERLQEGLAIEVAKQCVKIAMKHPNTVIIWGAETTVKLPNHPGKGGRNQHLALAAAMELEGNQ
ncbi:MAG: DUF4147 domain-containing protein, partial [Thiotrichaceae bacterium]